MSNDFGFGPGQLGWQQQAPEAGPLGGLQDSVAGVLDSADPRHPIIPGPSGSFLAWPGAPASYRAQAPVYPGQHRPPERLTLSDAAVLILGAFVVLAVIGGLSALIAWLIT